MILRNHSGSRLPLFCRFGRRDLRPSALAAVFARLVLCEESSLSASRTRLVLSCQCAALHVVELPDFHFGVLLLRVRALFLRLLLFLLLLHFRRGCRRCRFFFFCHLLSLCRLWRCGLSRCLCFLFL